MNPQRCETTQTMRYPVECQCGAIGSGIGPCVHWEPSRNPKRCVYCDHVQACHHKAAEWLEQERLTARSERTAINPAVLPALPGQKELTVTMLKDDGDVQADAAIDAIKAGTSTFQVTNPSSLFLHQLRLRVALEPALADRIAVYYLPPATRKWKPVGLGYDDHLRWPEGFEHDLWIKETQISAVYGMTQRPDKCVDAARTMAEELRRKYGC